MAVIDTPVHEKTREAVGATWGCHNHPPFKPGYWAKKDIVLWPWLGKLVQMLGLQRMVWVPHVMSTECRNDKSLTDPKCIGCKHQGSGEAYTEKVLREGHA